MDAWFCVQRAHVMDAWLCRAVHARTCMVMRRATNVHTTCIVVPHTHTPRTVSKLGAPRVGVLGVAKKEGSTDYSSLYIAAESSGVTLYQPVIVM